MLGAIIPRCPARPTRDRPLVEISRWPPLLVSAESDAGSAITCLHQARVRRETHAEVSAGAGATSCRHEWRHSTRLSQPRMSQLFTVLMPRAVIPTLTSFVTVSAREISAEVAAAAEHVTH